MIDQDYLNTLLRDIQQQLAEHEQNAIATRGAIQILEHLLAKSESTEGGSPPSEVKEESIEQSA